MDNENQSRHWAIFQEKTMNFIIHQLLYRHHTTDQLDKGKC